jgi:hypothetical protein
VTLTSAGAGAVCGVSIGLACGGAAVVASEIQYQASPGEKTPFGYAATGIVGAVIGRFGGGSLFDQGPVRFASSLVGRMVATFGYGWGRKFASQVVRTAVTSVGGELANNAWKQMFGGK